MQQNKTREHSLMEGTFHEDLVLLLIRCTAYSLCLYRYTTKKRLVALLTKINDNCCIDSVRGRFCLAKNVFGHNSCKHTIVGAFVGLQTNYKNVCSGSEVKTRIVLACAGRGEERRGEETRGIAKGRRAGDEGRRGRRGRARHSRRLDVSFSFLFHTVTMRIGPPVIYSLIFRYS